MGRRPLCLGALLLVLWTAVSGQTGGGKEPFPLQELQGCTVSVQGQVYRLEKKKEKNSIFPSGHNNLERKKGGYTDVEHFRTGFTEFTPSDPGS